jgi:hypothetical protein
MLRRARTVRAVSKITLPHNIIGRLKARTAGPGESLSDVIVRITASEAIG